MTSVVCIKFMFCKYREYREFTKERIYKGNFILFIDSSICLKDTAYRYIFLSWGSNKEK